MNAVTGSIEAGREIARRINGWHAQVELHRVACSQAVYDGLYATAQPYMTLSKAVSNAAVRCGFSLRQAYRWFVIAVAGAAQTAASRYSFPPMHTVVANCFEQWLHQKGDTATLPDQKKQTLRHDLRPLYQWLVSLFDDGESTSQRNGTARAGKRAG